MRVNFSGDHVVIGVHVEDPKAAWNAIEEWLNARYALRVVEESVYPKRVRDDAQERVEAAETEMEDWFSETLTVELAEEMIRRLKAAVLQAKLNRGDFEYDEGLA